ncbi:MAG: trypsin-like peptidase domain-containing protein [Candidatus Marinimicrobia bacterium]|nr:trypsin-like peptidase domain-containing protein [Candidatus Neomarinimicrobiota bacterium]
MQAASLEVLVDGKLLGSGWFVSPGGVGLTAAHLVRGGGKLEVISTDFGRMPARLGAVDLGRDLAVFYVKRSLKAFSFLQVSAKMPVEGQKLYLVGAPLFRQGIMISGEVAKPQTQFEWNNRNGCYTEVFPVSAMTPEGFSGAPWVDAEGKVFGLQSGLMAWKGAPMGIAFMSPLQGVSKLLADKKDEITVSLGAMLAEPWEQPVGLDPRNGFASEGIIVQQTFNSGPLANAGIFKGDTLLVLDGQKLRSRDELIQRVRSSQPWSELLFAVRRKSGDIDEVAVVLAPREKF